MISVHEWIQPTKASAKKPNWEWDANFATKLEVNQDLKPSQNVPKSPTFLRLLCNNPQWQQHGFSA